MALNDFLRGRSNTFDVMSGSGSQKDPYEYRVSYTDGQNGVYNSVIKFLPIPDGVISSNTDYIHKMVTWVTDPRNQTKRCIDNPSTIGDTKNVLDSLMWSLLTDKNPAIKQVGKDCLRRTDQYVALIQVVRDQQHPELTNKIMYFRFGKSINDKIMNEMNPNNGLGYCYPSPFDALQGRLFSISVHEKNRQNDYTASSFFNAPNIPTGFRYPGADNQWHIADENATDADFQLMNNYLMSELAKFDLTKHEYHPWNEETEAYVNEIISVIASTASGGTYTPQVGIEREANPVFGGPQAYAQPAAPTVQQPSAVQPTVPTPPVYSAPVYEDSQVDPLAGIPVPSVADVTAEPTPTPAPKASSRASRFGDLTAQIQ